MPPRHYTITMLAIFLTIAAYAVLGVPNRASSPVAATAAVYPDRPDPTLTPGDVRTTSVDEIRNVRTSTARNVPQSEKDAVYREYGLDPRHHQPCEVDHLISLELGGSNSIRNLWPEHYGEPNGARRKDRLENHLHALVVAGKVPLTEAQTAIATDWEAAEVKYGAMAVR